MTIDKSSDYHMHSLFSDGSAAVEEMALAAAEKGLTQITITDHMPLPFGTHYAMDKEKLIPYILAVKKAQSAYAGRIRINLGIEIEFIPQLRLWIQSIAGMEWDHLIVSVHRLYKDNVPGMVNGSQTEFNRLFQRFDFDIRRLYTTYYDTLASAYNTGWFTIAGHLDVIKKHNTDQLFFDESDPDYRAAVLKALDVIQYQKMKLEINTAGFDHPVGEQYPSSWIILEAAKRDIPMVLSSDSHAKESIANHFDAIDWFLKSTEHHAKRMVVI